MLSIVQPFSSMLHDDPSRPSFLTLRNANPYASFHQPMASCPNASESSKRPLERKSARKHPMLERRENASVRRRNFFLNRVKEAGEDKRWQVRGDQMLRKDFISQKKQWEEEMARNAPEGLETPEEDESEAHGDDYGRNGNYMNFAVIEYSYKLAEAEMVDDVLSQENQELEALLSLNSQENRAIDDQQHAMSDFGSDVDEYDSIFLDALVKVESEANQARATSSAQAGQILDSQMDTSMD
ncbi:MAG: hypothetical protein Q9191_003510 [Dirinaria sp. TL-2023a]